MTRSTFRLCVAAAIASVAFASPVRRTVHPAPCSLVGPSLSQAHPVFPGDYEEPVQTSVLLSILVLHLLSQARPVFPGDADGWDGNKALPSAHPVYAGDLPEETATPASGPKAKCHIRNPGLKRAPPNGAAMYAFLAAHHNAREDRVREPGRVLLSQAGVQESASSLLIREETRWRLRPPSSIPLQR